MSFRTRATHMVEVSDPQEYREAMDAADTLAARGHGRGAAYQPALDAEGQ